SYNRAAAYSQSKLANLMFTYELQRRLSAAATSTIAVAAHPGLAATELTRHSSAASAALARLISQPPAMGALPTLRAAPAPRSLARCLRRARPADQPAPGDGRPAPPARRDRPRRARRPVLRPGRIVRDPGLPGTGPFQRAIPRHGHPAPPVDGLRRAD